MAKKYKYRELEQAVGYAGTIKNAVSDATIELLQADGDRLLQRATNQTQMNNHDGASETISRASQLVVAAEESMKSATLSGEASSRLRRATQIAKKISRTASMLLSPQSLAHETLSEEPVSPTFATSGKGRQDAASETTTALAQTNSNDDGGRDSDSDSGGSEAESDNESVKAVERTRRGTIKLSALDELLGPVPDSEFELTRRGDGDEGEQEGGEGMGYIERRHTSRDDDGGTPRFWDLDFDFDAEASLVSKLWMYDGGDEDADNVGGEQEGGGGQGGNVDDGKIDQQGPEAGSGRKNTTGWLPLLTSPVADGPPIHDDDTNDSGEPESQVAASSAVTDDRPEWESKHETLMQQGSDGGQQLLEPSPPKGGRRRRSSAGGQQSPKVTATVRAAVANDAGAFMSLSKRERMTLLAEFVPVESPKEMHRKKKMWKSETRYHRLKTRTMRPLREDIERNIHGGPVIEVVGGGIDEV